MRKYIAPVLMLTLFEAIAITLWLTKDNIFYADWEATHINAYMYETYGNGKKKLPDAFVCANDQMAIFVLVFLEELGFKLPDDAIVTGFDNLHAVQVLLGFGGCCGHGNHLIWGGVGREVHGKADLAVELNT